MHELYEQNVHPVTRLVFAEEETQLSSFLEHWRALGFEAICRDFEYEGDEWDDAHDSYGMFMDTPADMTSDGWLCVTAFATEDGENVFVSVRPMNSFAEDLVRLCERHDNPD